MSTFAFPSASRPAVGDGIGAELIEKAALVQIVDNLPTQIDIQQNLWNLRDEAYATSRNIPFQQTLIAAPSNKNIFASSIPSLLDASPDTLPAIGVRIGPLAPSQDRAQDDFYDSFDVTMIVEVYSKVGPYADVIDDHGPVEEVDRQNQRLTAAVHACLRVDPTIGATTMPIQRPPRIRPSLPYVKKQSGAGQPYLYQARELTYVVTLLAL